MRLRLVICFIAVTSLVFAFVASAQMPEHFELKGERLGESLEAFNALHPTALCSKSASENRPQLDDDGCVVLGGVSFAGLPAPTDSDCGRIESKVGDGRNCWEGIAATFRNGKLIMLSYSVQAQGGKEWARGQVVDALAEKYGKADHFGWMNATEVLTVHANDFPVGHDKPTVSVIIIILGLKEDSAKKDI
jgi:hypothetical protein